MSLRALGVKHFYDAQGLLTWFSKACVNAILDIEVNGISSTLNAFSSKGHLHALSRCTDPSEAKIFCDRQRHLNEKTEG